MQLEVRRFHVLVEDVEHEGGQALPVPIRRVAAAAVVRNPWAGAEFTPDLSPVVRAGCPALAHELLARIVPEYGGAVEAFGKAVVVGTGGEVEHGAALVHNPFFSDVVRDNLGGASVIASTEARAGAGATVHVPLVHLTAATTRSHYQGMAVSVPDAPWPDEILVVVATSSGGRPLARIGDRRTDPAFDPEPWRVTST